jgi:23S rRNA (adenine2503-C2)-methyltransferase
MPDKINLFGHTLEQLEDYVVKNDFKKFTAKQIFQWMYQKSVYDFESMTNLSKSLRERLTSQCCLSLPEITDKKQSVDGTIKYLLKLEDSEHIETVNIPDDKRLTLCLSSQVGCPLGCRFCKTAQLGFRRNLEVGEILAQIALMRDNLNQDERITNLVFMGMGEPFLNYDNLSSAIEIIISVFAYRIGHRKITVSTAGHVPGIYRLTDDDLKVRLAISLNSVDQNVRNKLMPITKKYPLTDLRKAIIYHTEKTDCRVTFEYLLISGLTDTIAAAKKLVSFVADIPCKINLINFNPTDGLPDEFKPSLDKDMFKFRDYLYPRTPAVTIRSSKGSDIMAACGQLTGKKH